MSSTVREIRGTQRPGDQWDVGQLRREFPALEQQVHGHPLSYLDNAATTQKPTAVIEAIDAYYRRDNANVHRGVHALAERATAAYDSARETVRAFLNAGSTREIVFVRGTTEAINLVANSFGHGLREGDEIILTAMEHHANIVPWQLLRERVGVAIRVLPIDERGELRIDELEPLINERTRLVSVVHVSNALGTVNPVEEIISVAHRRGVPVLLDGAQATAHLAIDVQALDCDFYCLSGHKVFGPTGIGVLYGKETLLERMPPYQGGGEMIRAVSFEKTTYADLPLKFEAGTPHIAGAIGLAAAIDYLNTLDLEAAWAYEQQLLGYANEKLSGIEDLRIIGEASRKVPVLSLYMSDVHPHDLGTILDRRGIGMRAGHHCTMPLMRYFGIPATARASLAFYNTTEEIDRLVNALRYAREVMA
jgi:cysteine desulfurase/selenocysteine lyase